MNDSRQVDDASGATCASSLVIVVMQADPGVPGSIRHGTCRALRLFRIPVSACLAKLGNSRFFCLDDVSECTSE